MPLATAISRAAISCWVCLRLLGGTNQALANPAVAETGFAAHAERSFQEAQARYQKAPGEAAAAWQFGRACFDLAEFATNKTAARFPGGTGHRGLPAGDCARVQLGSGPLLPRHESRAIGPDQGAGRAQARGPDGAGIRPGKGLDEHLDYAGPDRNLGLLYCDAPVIGSIGSRARAREHLKRAVELAPRYPENQLSLIEAYLTWGERAGAIREFQALEEAWPAARTNFVGAAWTASWADWEPRLKKLKKKIEEPTKPLGAPSQKP